MIFLQCTLYLAHISRGWFSYRALYTWRIYHGGDFLTVCTLYLAHISRGWFSYSALYTWRIYHVDGFLTVCTLHLAQCTGILSKLIRLMALFNVHGEKKYICILSCLTFSGLGIRSFDFRANSSFFVKK